LQASQLLTVKRDVLVGLDFVTAENVRWADRLIVARGDQRLSDASHRNWRRCRLRLRFGRGGFEARRSRSRRADGFDRFRRCRFRSVDVMQANALPPRGAEQFHGN
jgi:hypothetical protein